MMVLPDCTLWDISLVVKLKGSKKFAELFFVGHFETGCYRGHPKIWDTFLNFIRAIVIHDLVTTCTLLSSGCNGFSLALLALFSIRCASSMHN